MQTTTDTIAAIATPPGEGGISIVRLSGPLALAIADDVFRCRPPKPSQRTAGTFVYGHVARGEEALDEALLLVMRAPHSYTGEDMVEIQGHGGFVAARRVLQRVLDAGARLAEPGEFTRRAFLNGRLDLLQAEAVLDLVRAKSDRAAAAALEQLSGTLSRKVDEVYSALLSAAADVEASLDFPEEDVPQQVLEALPDRLSQVRRMLEALLRSSEEGHLLREGALAVISGRPNVGKSTLLNGLLGRSRAIVCDIPGTTRDFIEETLVIDGLPLRLVDTAGLRETTCPVEQQAVCRAKELIARADFHIYVVDGSAPLPEEDRRAVQALPQARTLVVIGKADLGAAVAPQDLAPYPCVQACLITDAGIQAVRTALRALVERAIDLSVPPHAVVSERHRRLLNEAERELAACERMIKKRGSDEGAALAAEHLRSALDCVGRVTGKTFDDSLLDEIFSKFCIGK